METEFIHMLEIQARCSGKAAFSEINAVKTGEKQKNQTCAMGIF